MFIDFRYIYKIKIFDICPLGLSSNTMGNELLMLPQLFVLSKQLSKSDMIVAFLLAQVVYHHDFLERTLSMMDPVR
jgi:hypothetical protein